MSLSCRRCGGPLGAQRSETSEFDSLCSKCRLEAERARATALTFSVDVFAAAESEVTDLDLTMLREGK